MGIQNKKVTRNTIGKGSEVLMNKRKMYTSSIEIKKIEKKVENLLLEFFGITKFFMLSPIPINARIPSKKSYWLC